MDKYYEDKKKTVHAVYNHHFTKILLAYEDGFLGSLDIEAEKYPNEDEEDPEGREQQREPTKIEADNTCIGPYHRSRIILIR